MSLNCLISFWLSWLPDGTGFDSCFLFLSCLESESRSPMIALSEAISFWKSVLSSFLSSWSYKSASFFKRSEMSPKLDELFAPDDFWSK